MTKAASRSTALAFALTLLGWALPLAAETAETVQDTGDTAYVIKEETFNIRGRTRVEALKKLIGSAEGLGFPDVESLTGYAEQRAKRLEKLRAFKKSSVSVEWLANEGEAEPNGRQTRFARLVVDIEDGSAFIPIPYAFYNSNDGLQAGTILNVPNLAGTLQNLFVIGLYTAPPDENDMLQWTNPNFMLITTLSGIEAGPVSLSVAGSALRMNRETEYRGVTGVKAKMTALSGTLGITKRFGDNLSNTLSFRVAGSPDNELVSVGDPDLLAYGPIELSATVKNEILFDSYDWIGNFRDGWKASFGLDWERAKPRHAAITDSVTAEAEASVYHAMGSFNPGITVTAVAKTGNPELTSASRTRGVRNGELAGNYGVFARSGVQTRVARFSAAEIDVSPALDLFWVRDPGAPDYEDDYGVGVGAEVLFLFDAMKSLPVKLGFSWDCRPEERVVGGKRLEVDFSFSLSY